MLAAIDSDAYHHAGSGVTRRAPRGMATQELTMATMATMAVAPAMPTRSHPLHEI
ncbi:hypothetical protein [Sorangium atrum]|uniref:Uncharacterized protein n=1 Tax=Sorangium atrum TaxID=2995308 RepID=A0ABT5BYV4_9BACT|nr:hypothetical protein [Sorangium aterium]MDC0678805.1 hypothetical protein [Sorangium aterium]